MAKQDRAGVWIHRLAHVPQLIRQGQRFRNSHRPPARRASTVRWSVGYTVITLASSGVSTATQGRSKKSNTRARLPPRLRSRKVSPSASATRTSSGLTPYSAHFSRACWLNCKGECDRLTTCAGDEFRLGLQPVRGLVDVGPRWRVAAEWVVRAGAPGGSGGSPSSALRHFGGGGTRWGVWALACIHLIRIGGVPAAGRHTPCWWRGARTGSRGSSGASPPAD
jgi:hypothetical protein